MLIEIIIALVCGVACGIITGLLPGVHINLVAAILLSLPAFAEPLTLVIFIVAMTACHGFFDFIPSIFLGCPDEDTGLSILPGHELLLKGKGYEAVLLSLYGCLFGVILALVLTAVFIFIMPKIFFYLKFVMFFILIIANIYLLLKEERKALAFLVFLMSGILGVISINLPVNNSLLPLLSGLFGSSSLITSIIRKEKLPKQEISNPEIKIRDFIKPGLAGMLTAPLCSFLPALGSNQAAVLGSDIIDEKRKNSFLILIGIINGMVICLSFVALYSLGKARTGTAAAVGTIMSEFSLHNLIIILLVILIASIFAFLLARKTARIMAKNIAGINYQFLSLAVLIFISLLVLYFSGILGFLVFITATAIGLTAIMLKVRRTNMMASLMLPAIFFYLPI